MAGGTEGLVRRDVVKAVCIRPPIREVRASRGGKGAQSEGQLGTDTGDDRRLQLCARGYVGQAKIIASTGRNQERCPGHAGLDPEHLPSGERGSTARNSGVPLDRGWGDKNACTYPYLLQGLWQDSVATTIRKKRGGGMTKCRLEVLHARTCVRDVVAACP